MGPLVERKNQGWPYAHCVYGPHPFNLIPNELGRAWAGKSLSLLDMFSFFLG